MRYSAWSSPAPQEPDKDPQQRNNNHSQRNHANQTDLVTDLEDGGIDQAVYRCVSDHVSDVHGQLSSPRRAMALAIFWSVLYWLSA